MTDQSQPPRPIMADIPHEQRSTIRREALEEAPNEMNWRSLSEMPDRPMRVLLYYPSEVSAPPFDGCDYAIQLAWWDGTKHSDFLSGWFEQGTNHDVFERWRRDTGCVPTLWAPVLEPGRRA